jgi:hypothetical protein
MIAMAISPIALAIASTLAYFAVALASLSFACNSDCLFVFSLSYLICTFLLAAFLAILLCRSFRRLDFFLLARETLFDYLRLEVLRLLFFLSFLRFFAFSRRRLARCCLLTFDFALFLALSVRLRERTFL